jgi:asparagine synthase (glutamine-hydrolysing)
MTNEAGNIWAIVNGEIYNHRELRRKLQAKGHVFKSYSDSEVVPHLYEEDGIGFVQQLRGMFAVALYDARQRALLLARDRFGIKPLFYAPGFRRLAFSSEINALLEFPGIDLQLDSQALYDFAALLYIPAPETIYSGIRALEPGEILSARLENDRVSLTSRKFHHWSLVPDYNLRLSEAVERADELVTQAVNRQLESDVPLGSLLSGGIDSSLISAAAQTGLNGKLRTFNVRFQEREADETWAARTVAERIGSHHETLDIDDFPGSWDYVEALLEHVGQPFADTSLFAVNAVCAVMRQHVTVALSGDGGDEGFGGYNFYSWVGRVDKWRRLPAAMWQMASIVLAALSRIRLAPERLPMRLWELAGADEIATVQTLFCPVRGHEHEALCRRMDVLPLRRLFEPNWNYDLRSQASGVERLYGLILEANVRLSLPNDYLFKVDMASMKEGLEVRVPLLDEELFNFALSLPYHLKVHGSTCKRVLREIASQKLPSDIATKAKQGFSLPVDVWVDANFKRRLRSSLLGSNSGLDEFFEPEIYRPIIEAFCDGRVLDGISRQGLYRRAIMFLAVHLTLQRCTRHSLNPSVSAE